MVEIVKIMFIGLFFGTCGTLLGGIIGIQFKSASNRFLSFMLAIASGLMMAIVTLDLIPESLEYGNIYIVLAGIFFGILLIIFCDSMIEKEVNKKFNSNNKSLIKTALVVAIGLAIHNFPEGLAIGSSMEVSIKLGLSLAIAICIHDIPEGISMAIPMRGAGIGKRKILLYILLSGVTTGIGALFGALVGGISDYIISLCLSFAAGAMIYIVAGELIPEYNNLYRGRITVLGNILGLIGGILISIV